MSVDKYLSIFSRQMFIYANCYCLYMQMILHSELTLEHRRYSHALTLFNKCLYNMGPISKEMFIFRNYEHDLRDLNRLHQPTYNSRFIDRSYHLKITEQSQVTKA